MIMASSRGLSGGRDTPDGGPARRRPGDDGQGEAAPQLQGL